MASLVFENTTVQELYNRAHSDEFAKLERANDMREFVLPFITAVVDDKQAYSEAISKWSEFRAVKDHLEKEQPTIQGLDLNTSMCTSLWFYIYH
jgi:hypothetical protein